MQRSACAPAGFALAGRSAGRRSLRADKQSDPRRRCPEVGWLPGSAEARSSSRTGRTVPATVVGYDHETGFGLLRAIVPLKTAPIGLGKSADLREGEPVL